MKALPAPSFWSGKRVFLTYPTGFLGAWTAMYLRHLGAEVFGFSDESAKIPNLFDLSNLAQNISMTYGDLRNQESVREALHFAQADVVLHLGEAGLLREAEKQSLEVISKAVIGTAVLMELLRETASIRSLVVVSSDKVYSRKLGNIPYSEEDAVGPVDILPAAKLCSELIALSYRHSYFHPHKYNKHKVAIATARVGAALGGGDFSETSLIPQAVQCFISQAPLAVRNPNSVRPWIHVLDQVAGLLLLAQSLYEKGPKLLETYNLGAKEYESVEEVLREFAQSWGAQEKPTDSVAPKRSLSIHGQLNSEQAKIDLGWEPSWDLSMSLKQTAEWYKSFHQGSDVSQKTLLQFCTHGVRQE